jgi:glycosyltransferase involved in cell wall biosynthesis
MADHIIVHTNRLRTELIDDFGQLPKKITVIPHGINTVVRKDTLTRDDAKRSLGICEENRVLLFFGHIKPYKGLEYLIDALAILVRDGFSQIRLVVAGQAEMNTDYWDWIRNRIQIAGLEKYVLAKSAFIPEDDIEALFKAADCLVLPYRHATQSGALFIAYAYGVPVIAADVGSFHEDIKRGQTGFLFRSEDASDLSRTIKAFYQSELYSNCEYYKSRIVSLAETDYSWRKIGRSTLEIYGRVIGRNSGL